MAPPRAVVLPFGVPTEGRGLGLGLAALVHAFARVEGAGVGLAQLHGKREGDEAAPGVVEAFVPPSAWKELAAAGQAPTEVDLVLTGAFEPPGEGRGLLQLLAFDAKDGAPRARVEAHLDALRAGATVGAALGELWQKLAAGDVGLVKDIEDLPWDALESVLLAERCAVHDPERGGPHDRLAAMMHLGRAVQEAPDARFPAARLAALAVDVGVEPDAKLAEAARRALTRAMEDAPGRVELAEALAALELRRGDATRAAERLARIVAERPERARAHALLSEARRARGDVDGALDAVHAGLARAPDDPALLAERGAVLLDRGDAPGATADWTRAMERSPLYPSAFAGLASLALKTKDAALGEQLVDRALFASEPPVDVLRRAIGVALAVEPDGLPRAARLAQLARALTERAPLDPWGHFVLARARAQLREKDAAVESLAAVERIAPGSALAAEAQRGRFTLKDPEGALAVESLLRAAYGAAAEDLEALAARGRRLAQRHEQVWSAHFALGLVERRRERWAAARAALDDAVRACPGSTPAHLELVGVAIALRDADAALRHADTCVALEGETARTLAVRAAALLAAGRQEDAKDAVTRSLALDPNDEANRALSERIARGSVAPPRPLERLRDTFTRWLK